MPSFKAPLVFALFSVLAVGGVEAQQQQNATAPAAGGSSASVVGNATSTRSCEFGTLFYSLFCALPALGWTEGGGRRGFVGRRKMGRQSEGGLSDSGAEGYRADAGTRRLLDGINDVVSLYRCPLRVTEVFGPLSKVGCNTGSRGEARRWVGEEGGLCATATGSQRVDGLRYRRLVLRACRRTPRLSFCSRGFVVDQSRRGTSRGGGGQCMPSLVVHPQPCSEACQKGTARTSGTAVHSVPPSIPSYTTVPMVLSSLETRLRSQATRDRIIVFRRSGWSRRTWFRCRLRKAGIVWFKNRWSE